MPRVRAAPQGGVRRSGAVLSEAGPLDGAPDAEQPVDRGLPPDDPQRGQHLRARRVTGREAGSSRGMVTYRAYVGGWTYTGHWRRETTCATAVSVPS